MSYAETLGAQDKIPQANKSLQKKFSIWKFVVDKFLYSSASKIDELFERIERLFGEPSRDYTKIRLKELYSSFSREYKLAITEYKSLAQSEGREIYDGLEAESWRKEKKGSILQRDQKLRINELGDLICECIDRGQNLTDGSTFVRTISVGYLAVASILNAELTERLERTGLSETRRKLKIQYHLDRGFGLVEIEKPEGIINETFSL